jgi:tape measure domain-containing protein
MADHKIGRIFVELDLDPSRYMRSQQTIRKEAENGAKTMEKNFHNLGIKSEAMYRLQVAQARQAYKQIVISGKVSADEIVNAEKAKFYRIAQLEKERMAQISRINGEQVAKTKSMLSQIQRHWLASAAAIYAAWRGISLAFQASADIFKAGMEAQMMTKAFGEIAGSAAGAAEEFSFLRDVAKELGQNFWDLQGTYKGLLAASKGTSLEGEKVRDVFYAVTRAATTLGLSAEKVKLTLYAVEQMVSKATVTSEELRRQMGDNLPGAFAMAAQAMSMTTTEFNNALKAGKIMSEDFLPKFAAVLKEKFSGAVADSIRATNEWNQGLTDLKVAVGDGAFMENYSSILQSLADAVSDPQFQASMAQLVSDISAIGANVASKENLQAIVQSR